MTTQATRSGWSINGEAIHVTKAHLYWRPPRGIWRSWCGQSRAFHRDDFHKGLVPAPRHLPHCAVCERRQQPEYQHPEKETP